MSIGYSQPRKVSNQLLLKVLQMKANLVRNEDMNIAAPPGIIMSREVERNNMEFAAEDIDKLFTLEEPSLEGGD